MSETTQPDRPAAALTPLHYRAIRQASGLTQAQIAARFEVTDRSVRRWETSHNPPAEVVDWVAKCWADVRAVAAEVGQEHPTDVWAITLPLVAPGLEDYPPNVGEAATRLAMGMLEIDGMTVTIE